MTVGTFEALQKHKGPKVTTVMRVATRTAPIPVTVGGLEACHWGVGRDTIGGGEGGLGTHSAGPYMYLFI